MSDSSNQQEPQPETQSSGSGGGPKIRTAVGLGGSGDGNFGGGGGDWNFQNDPPEPFGPNEPTKHEHLKDLAIRALTTAPSADYRELARRIANNFAHVNEFQSEIAEALTEMVLTAYTVAQHYPGNSTLEVLQTVCPYFSKMQLLRIVELARR